MAHRRMIAPLFALSLLLALAACNSEPEPPPQPEKPPEPPVANILGEMRQALGGVLAPGPGDPAALSPEFTAAAIKAFQGVQAKHRGLENAVTALQRIRAEVDEATRTAAQANHWAKVRALCAVGTVVSAGEARPTHLCERADVMLARPSVSVRGFVEQEGEVIVFLTVVDPDTQKSSEYRVREGETFHKVLRLIEIIGGKQAVRLEYVPAGDSDWVIQGPSERH